MRTSALPNRSRRVPHPPAAAIVVLAVAALALLVPPTLADGLVIVRPTPDFPNPTQLAVRYHNVDIAIRDQVANVKIVQVFRNLNHHELEGEYLFPIPDGAAVSDFVLYVDGRPVHAEAMDAQQALRIYEDLVRESRDPALLEYAGREIFRARIYPFPPNGERQVALDYDQLVTREGGLYRFVYPLSTEKFSSQLLDNAYVKIDLVADKPICNAYCPSHNVDIDYVNDRHIRVTWEESRTRPDTDLVLYYSLAEGPLDLRLVPYKPGLHEDGYFMLLGAMGSESDFPIRPKDIVFVVDHSGSMDGEKIDQAREALLYCLDHLNPRDRFNVISFSTEVEPFASELCRVSPRALDQARDYVERLEADGSTNIELALETALDADFSRERPAIIMFVTDGLPTEGEQDPARILKHLLGGHDAPDRVRIFPFGVGYDVNAIFLDQLALEHGGAPSYVRPTEDLSERIAAFYDQVAQPVMTDLELTVDGTRFRMTEPARLPDLFRGGQLVLFGRYRDAGRIEITLSGNVEGRRETYTTVCELPDRSVRNEFVGRLWATRRVGSLLKRIRLYGEEHELVEEVKDLGLRFGLVTPYTSFLVDEDAPLADGDAMYEGKGRGRADGSAHDSPWGRLGNVFGRHKSTSPPRMSSESVSLDAVPAASSGYNASLPQAGGQAAPAPTVAMKAATGQAAFEVSEEVEALASARAERREARDMAIRRVGERIYRFENGVWRDTECPGGTTTVAIEIGSSSYFTLLQGHPELGAVLALGEQVVFEVEDLWYETRSAP
jgi:Ca-activated chloride channel family protein